MMIALCVLILVTECGSWFQGTIRADAGAVDEVRGIGRVVAQTTADPIYGDTIQIEDVLIMDVGAPSFEMAMDSARKLLERRGWTTMDKLVTYVSMKSTRWGGTSLTIDPFQKLASYSGSTQKRIAEKVHIEPTDQNKYILVVVTRV
ncbi:hypothetical protein [Nonomuraea sp. NPDC049480]|uniref:hypothetical protein n=1 Tax=Nonomuraea sp. NPDC049480 TaxID=3364353 RepID=UPI0037B69BCE